MNENKYSITELANRLSVHRQTLTRKIADSNLAHTPGPKNSKLYDLDAVVALMSQQQSTDLASEQLRLTIAKREKVELENAIKRGEYVSITEVTAAVSTEYGTVRAQLLAMPSGVSKHISNLGSNTEEINKALTKAINDILENLQADAMKFDSEVDSTPE